MRVQEGIITSFERKNTVFCFRVYFYQKMQREKKMPLINMKLKNRAVRKNTKHCRYCEATSCFLRLGFISAGILYITMQKIKVGKQ